MARSPYLRRRGWSFWRGRAGRTGPLLLAILVPAMIGIWLLTAMLRPVDNPRVIRCGADVEARGTPVVQLSAAECALVGNSIGILARDQPADVKRTPFGTLPSPVIMGQQAPASVELRDLPADVVQAAPKLAAYRYFLSGDDIALVDPQSRMVVTLVEVHAGPGGTL